VFLQGMSLEQLLKAYDDEHKYQVSLDATVFNNDFFYKDCLDQVRLSTHLRAHLILFLFLRYTFFFGFSLKPDSQRQSGSRERIQACNITFVSMQPVICLFAKNSCSLNLKIFGLMLSIH